MNDDLVTVLFFVGVGLFLFFLGMWIGSWSK